MAGPCGTPAAALRLTPRHRTVLTGCAGIRARRVLDVGCGDGSFTTVLGSRLGAVKLYGVELGAEAAAAAERSGLRMVQADLAWGALPFADGAFDFVFAGEIIEHLIDTDGFCREMRRLLSPGGTLVVTTPNIAAWYNRVQLLLGFQPYSVPVSEAGPAGMIFRSTTPEQYRREREECDGYLEPSAHLGAGHVRFFTTAGLVALLKLHGFTVRRKLGTSFVPAFRLGRIARSLVELAQTSFEHFPSLADDIVVIASI